MSIESIDEQFITLGTKTYDLVIDITGTPDKVEATGLLEGFYQDWDARMHSSISNRQKSHASSAVCSGLSKQRRAPKW